MLYFLDMKKWITASRPKTLWVTLCPVSVGSMLAYVAGSFHLWASLAALFSGILIQIGTNLANDYFDFKKGADTSDRVGPKRFTQSGEISESAMKTAFIVSFAGAFLMGLYLVYRAGWPLLVLGIISILCGVFYTAGPFAMAYTGTADLFVFVFFGPIAVLGTYYVNSLQFDPHILLSGIPLGLISVAILVVNNLRDYEGDKRVGKKTLVVRFGRTFGRIEYTLCLLLASLLPLQIFINSQKLEWIGVFALSIALSIPNIWAIWRLQGAALNPYLGKTAQFLLIYTLLYNLSVLL